MSVYFFMLTTFYLLRCLLTKCEIELGNLPMSKSLILCCHLREMKMNEDEYTSKPVLFIVQRNSGGRVVVLRGRLSGDRGR